MTSTDEGAGAALIEATRALAPRIQAARDEIEAGRRLPLGIVQAIREAGIIRMTMPRAWGGPEADPWIQIRVIEELSRIDGSVGWCAMIGSDGGYFSAFLEPAVGRALYQDLDAVTASVIRPSGRARAVEGGYRVTGCWAFASGCQHSAWLVGNCVVHDGDRPRRDADGNPETRLCFLPASACQILDTWTTTGLRGSGSHDYLVEDYFVPVEQTFSIFTSPISRPEPLYQFRQMYLVNVAGVPLGIARGAIEELIALAGHKVTRLGNGLRDEPYVQLAVAQAEALVGSARSYVHETVADLWSTLLAGSVLSTAQRVRLRLAISHAFSAGVQAVDLMYQAGGGSSLYAPHPLDRHFRDIHTSNQHTVISPKTYYTAGRLLLGLESDIPNF